MNKVIWNDTATRQYWLERDRWLFAMGKSQAEILERYKDNPDIILNNLPNVQRKIFEK